MNAISLDFETFSRADIKQVGAYKYAEDPSTEILVIAINKHGSDEIVTWDARQPIEGNPAIALLLTAIQEKWEIHAFNAQFEWAILKYVATRQFGFHLPDINTMRCTAAVCRSAGMPPSLAKSAAFLKLPIQKDTAGKALIRAFSVPQKAGVVNTHTTEGLVTIAGERVTYSEAFQMFVDYCVQDVRTEVAVAEKMKPYQLKGFPLDWFLLDMRLNDRGVPVDTEALSAAYDMYVEKERATVKQFQELTGFSPSQTARCLEWLKARGYKRTSLAKADRELAAKKDDLTDDAELALRLRSQLSYAAVKKIPSMRQMAMNDGKIRGSFMWCGAQKTWRWTSRTPQWQNMKKPPKWMRYDIENTYQTIRNRDLDVPCFESIYGNCYEIIASLARYFVRFPNCNVIDLDFASVEARILPFLIESDRIMDKIKTGADIYESVGKALGEVLREKYKVPFSIDRDTAKTVVLATQFQGGWNAVYTATGSKWNREWCETAVKIVRSENPEFPVAWRKFQDSFIQAMQHPHKWIQVTKYVAFAYTTKAPFPRMLMRLASGRCITYPYPEIKPITMAKIVTKVKGKTVKLNWERVAGHLDEDSVSSYLDVGDSFLYPDAEVESTFRTYELSFYGHVEGINYGRVNTYGGDLLQSATQGTGADLLAYGAISAEKAGFEPFLLVHDQALAKDNGKCKEFEKAMCSIPHWFEGFPLEAEADVVRSYCKS